MFGPTQNLSKVLQMLEIEEQNIDNGLQSES